MTPSATMKPELKVAPDPGEQTLKDDNHGRTAQKSPAPSSMSARVIRGFFQLLLPVLVIAAGIGVYNYLKATKPEAPKRQAKPNVFAVKVVPVAFTTVQPQLTLYGSTVAGRRVEIRALVAGQVAETSPDLRDGGKIKAGETILTIDSFNYKTAIEEADAQANEVRAKIAEFRASLAVDKGNVTFARQQEELATTDLKRAEGLTRRGAVTERALDERRLLVNQRRQAVAQLTNNIAVWEARINQQQAVLRRLETTRSLASRRLAETKLTAPFDAYVTEVGAQVGRMVGVNDRVATLIDRNWIEVTFTVTDRQFGRLARGNSGIEGRPIEVRWNVGEEPLIYQAKIDRVGASVSSEAGGVQLYARIDEPASGVGLRPGAFVELRVPDTEFDDVARLPSTAVFGGDTVFAVNDGKLVSRKIKIIANAGSDVLVRGALQPGEKIMTTRLSRPGDGVLVKEIAADGTIEKAASPVTTGQKAAGKSNGQ